MQTRTLLAAVATAAIAAMVTPSLSNAQDTTKKAVSKGEVAMAPSFSSLISAINSGTASSDKIKSLTTVNAADVQFVNVEDLLKGNDPQALNDALSKNKEGVDALQSALGSNPALNLLLASSDSAAAKVTPPAAAPTPMPSMAKPSAKDIVAADVSADNKVVLYYWKKQ